MTYDIDSDKNRKGFDRWHVVEYAGSQGRFLTRTEASTRAGDLNDEYDGRVRDRINPRWRGVAKMQSRRNVARKQRG